MPQSSSDEDESYVDEEDEEDEEKEESETSSSSTDVSTELDVENLNSSPDTWKEAEKLERALEKAKVKNMHKEKEEKDANDSVLEDPLGIIPNIPKSRFKTLKVSTPFQDDFIAAKYIATFHATTGYEALLGKARKSVQERLVQQKKASKYFIKSNVGKFVSTKDTLEEIFDSSDSLPTKSDWVDRLNFTYRDLQRMGSILFQPMMLTMKKGKELQSMANLVDRLRFIFNIPTDISDGIEKEEYKRVVHEYKKAKLIMSESKQQIFVNMFHKIKQQVVVVVDKLFKMLKDATLSYDEKQRIISYLVELDPPEDPLWFFLHHQCECINNLLTDCLHTTETKSHHHHYPAYDKAQSVAKLILDEKEVEDQFKENAIHTNVTTSAVVVHLCATLIEHLPSFWKHSKSILDEKIILQKPAQKKRTNKKVQMERLLIMQQQEREKRDAQIEQIFMEIASTWSNVGIEALGMIDNGTSSQPELLASLWEIIHCNEYIQTKSGIPANYVSMLATTTNDMKKFVMEQIGNSFVTEIRCLYVTETWELIRDGPYTKSYPLVRMKILHFVRDLMWFMNSDQDTLLVKKYMIDSLLAFSDTLHHLTVDANSHTKVGIKVPTTTGSFRTSQSFVRYTSNNKPQQVSVDQQFLLILCNCQYMKQYGLNNIVKTIMNVITTAKSGEMLNTDLNQTDRTADDDDEEEEEEEDESTTSTRQNTRSRYNRRHTDDGTDDDEDEDDDDDTKDEDDESYTTSTTSRTSKSDPQRSHQINQSFKNNMNIRALDDFQDSKEFMDIFRVYGDLENYIFDSYLRFKTLFVNQYVKKGIYVGNFDWSRAPQPTQVRPYVIELLMDLALLHFQTEIITDEFTVQVFSSLNERLSELLWEHIVNGITSLSVNGATQLDIEITFLNTALSNYSTDTSERLYSKLSKYLKKCAENQMNAKLKKQLLDTTMSSTRMQFSCFV